MYDDDQRQALGQPSLDIPYVEDDCGSRSLFFVHFFCLVFIFYLQDIFSIVLFLFSFVQYAVYDHVLSNHANII